MKDKRVEKAKQFIEFSNITKFEWHDIKILLALIILFCASLFVGLLIFGVIR